MATDDLVGRVETLLDQADEQTLEVVSAVVEMYGEALARMVAIADGESLARDDLVTQVLAIHDLHPVPLEQRVRAVIGTTELLAIEGSVLRLRASTGMEQRVIEAEIAKVAPEIERVEFRDAPAPILVLPQVPT